MGVFPGVWWTLALAAALAGPVAAADQSEIVFDEFTLKATYISENHFDMRAMGSVYNASPYIIDFIAKKQAYPEGFVSVSDGFVELPAAGAARWRPLLAHYAGPAAVLVAAVLLAALLPLTGVVWLCCVWCRAGRRRRPFDRKYDACLKGLLAILLISLLTLFLFGVVCAFATEQQLEEGAARAGGGARAAGRDVLAFLNHTHTHAHHLLVHNYRTLRAHIDAALAGGGESIGRALFAESGLGALDELGALVEQLPALKTELDRLHSGTALLRYHAEQLNAGLRKVKGKLLHTLANCDQPQCKRLQEKYRINQLDTEIQYSQIPDVTPLLSNLSALASSGVQAELRAARRALDDLPRAAGAALAEQAPHARRALDHTESELKKLSDEIAAQCAAGADVIENGLFPAAERLDAWHAAHGSWRRLLALVAAGAALLMTFLLSCGLACGVCGARPDAYGAASCCHKGAGASSLMCGTGMIFVLGGVMSLVMAAYFVLGITAQRFVCDPLTTPEGNRLFADVEQLVDLEEVVFQSHQDPSYTLQAVLQRCHHNYTIYMTLGLERKYNMSALLDAARAEARAALSAPRAEARAALSAPRPPPRAPAPAPAPRALLPPAARDKLRALAHSGLADFRYHAVLDALSTSATSLALGPLAEQLESAARAVAGRAGGPGGAGALAASLRDAAGMLAALQRDRAKPLDAQIRELNETANNIRDRLKLDTSSLEARVLQLLQRSQEAEDYLNTRGHQRLLDLTQELAANLSGAVGQYLELVERGARFDVARCEPMSRAYNHTRDHLCRNVLLPVNGFWISLAWCMLLFVPLTLVARRLACLYRTREPYPGPLVEAEYLYDAYADRDNVPLANAYKAEKRRGRGASGSGGAGLGGAGGAAGPAGGGARAGGSAGPAPPLDAHHARRYHDMAPKHWEEGPPRYAGPGPGPAEYERPPPYYFPPPTPHDRQ